jgi:hypothetical protein
MKAHAYAACHARVGHEHLHDAGALRREAVPSLRQSLIACARK